jgi:hypothetical protein
MSKLLQTMSKLLQTMSEPFQTMHKPLQHSVIAPFKSLSGFCGRLGFMLPIKYS